jgi:hypothetical protein
MFPPPTIWINLVYSTSPSDPVQSFQDLRGKPALMESKSITQARQASVDDRDIRIGVQLSFPSFSELNSLGLPKQNNGCKNDIEGIHGVSR